MWAIEVHDVWKRFRRSQNRFWALQAVNFHVQAGEIFAVLGPNGAGKSTLLYTIMGLLIPDRGAVRVLGHDVHRNPEAMHRVAFVSPEARFHDALRVRDVLWLWGRAHGLSRRALRRRMESWVDFFAIGPLMNQRVGTLSTGERVRLVLAKAMMVEPDVLLLDEPTVGLDPAMAHRIRQEIRTLNETRRLTVLLTSHSMQEVEQLAHRVAFLFRGRILEVDTVDAAVRRHFRFYQVRLLVPNGDAVLPRLGYRPDGDGWWTRSVARETGLQSLLEEIVQAGVWIERMEVRYPNLEDYFLLWASKMEVSGAMASD